ncbi:MAG: ABC transporter substrate-binding protein [Deltaproteobacteria bacterium]|nr:ABC transporter substrate-binding protein [Deltaproteobacteria bacterium]
MTRWRKQTLWLVVLVARWGAISSASVAEAAELTYEDKLGRVVNVTIPVNRAVLLISYELLPTLKVWDKVVGVARWAYSNDLMKAVRPDLAKSIPSVGDGTTINIEALLRLKPDVVITWTSRPDNVRFMEEKGLKVISVYPESLKELYQVMKMHGRLFAKEKEMEASIAEMERIFKLITDRVSKVPEGKKKKIIWLGGKPTTVACGVGVTNDILQLIGGVNPAAQILERNADIPMERIIGWNPEVVFIWGNAAYDTASILGGSQWRSVSAIRDGQVYKAPSWSTWSPRLAPIALWMAMRTYPHYFRDINLDQVVDEFYRKNFGVSFKEVEGFEH